MNIDILARTPLPELERMLPNLTPIEVRRARKRATNAVWQRQYRKEGRDKVKRPATRDTEYDKYVRDCIEGSRALLTAIQSLQRRAA